MLYRWWEELEVAREKAGLVQYEEADIEESEHEIEQLRLGRYNDRRLEKIIGETKKEMNHYRISLLIGNCKKQNKERELIYRLDGRLLPEC